jgi:arabinose-5-phosphate isomerase
MTHKFQQVLDFFLQNTLDELSEFVHKINIESLTSAANVIWNAQAHGGRIHITGIGKSAHVASYIAALMSSTGTPTYFLDSTEALHGSSGQLLPGDVVICVSNSGETIEMKSTVLAIKNNGCNVIAVTGNSDSWLAKQGQVHLFAGISHEGDPLNRAPRMSFLAQCLVLQALSLVLQAERDVTIEQYVKWHPGGALGR